LNNWIFVKYAFIYLAACLQIFNYWTAVILINRLDYVSHYCLHIKFPFLPFFSMTVSLFLFHCFLFLSLQFLYPFPCHPSFLIFYLLSYIPLNAFDTKKCVGLAIYSKQLDLFNEIWNFVSFRPNFFKTSLKKSLLTLY